MLCPLRTHQGSQVTSVAPTVGNVNLDILVSAKFLHEVTVFRLNSFFIVVEKENLDGSIRKVLISL